MKTPNPPSRRKFIKQSAIASTAMILPACHLPKMLLADEESDADDINVSIFSKQLQFLDYKNMSEAVREMGFDGVDLTVRRKGHVLPEGVMDDLPLVTEAMQSFGLKPNLFSTGVKDAYDPIDRKVLEVASQLGYQTYRTAWFKYKRDKDILDTVAYAQKQLNGLSELNKKLNIKGGYQNHSGHYFGSGIWDLQSVLSDISSGHIGSQYDIMHATVEGGKNWGIGFELIRPYVNSLVLKDFLWKKKDGKWAVHYVPIGEGMIDFSRFFSLLKEYDMSVPFTIHVEYDLGGAEHGGIPSIDNNEVFRRIKKDLDYVRQAYKDA